MSQPQGFVQGAPLTLTWGFMDDGTPINDGGNAPSNLQARLNAIYGNQSVWQPIFQSVFDRWSSISGLSYVYEPNDDGATMTSSSFPPGVLGLRADVRIGGKFIDGNSNVLAYNYYPNAAEMVIDTADNFYDNTGGNSIRLRNVVAHEHGHGVGMPHVESTNASFLMEPFLNTSFDGPQYHDILAAHRMYGDFNEKSFAGQGNDVAARATSMGTLTTSVPLRVGTSASNLVVSSTATDFVSIDDNTDTDFYSFTVAAGGLLNVRLDPRGFIYNVTAQGSGGAVPFDTTLRSDLALALFGVDGATMLASSTLVGFGRAEQLFFNLLAGGTYFLRVTGIDNPDGIALDAQFYSLLLNFAPAPEPATWLLVGAAGAVFAWRRRRC